LFAVYALSSATSAEISRRRVRSQTGKPVRGIPLDEAAKIAERIGLPPP